MKEIKNIFNYLKRNKYRLGVFIFSIIFLIITSIFFNFFIMLFIALLINLIWIIPYLTTVKKINFQKLIKKKKEIKINDFNEKSKPKLKDSDNMKRVRRVKEKKIKERKVKDIKPKNNKKKKSKLKIVLLIFLILFILGILAVFGFFTYIAASAGKFDPKKLYTKEASVMYDSEGKQFAQLGTEMRQKIKYDGISEELINAIVATEDSRFFQHNGFDLPRFVKASMGQAMGKNAGGASTLTMQVSKNQFTSTTSSGFAGIKRKFTDIYMAIFQIERKYSKEEIMEFYVNSYYLGSGAYGVEQAAKTYFQKSAKDLNLSEAAMIAGMFQSPVVYDPNLNPENTEARRLVVLKLMKRHGYITNEEYEMAKKMTVDKIVIKGGSARTNSDAYQGFIDTVAVEVKEKTGYDPYSYSMKIYTTMKRDKQDLINKIMKGESYSWENDKIDAGIAVIDTKTGEIVAIGAGRKREGEKSFNNATMMKKQIGSTAKPLFDYGPAIEYLNWNTYHPIIDAKYTYSNGTEINNWDGGYKGIITIRQALVDSRNIPALKTFQSVKNSDVLNFVTKLGLSPEASNGSLHEAHSIGGYNGESPLSVAAAYAAFGNEGVYNTPHSFTKVIFEQNGKTFEAENEKEKVMSKDTAYMVTDMLVDTGKNALGRYNNINGEQFAAKTGTTNFDKETKRIRRLPDNAVNDLWVAGYNPDYSIAVWYGYDKISDGYNRFGSSQNSRLFQAVAKNFFTGGKKFNKPDTVVEVAVEKNCGEPLLPSSNTPSSEITTELFKSSAKPSEVSNRFNKLDNPSDVKASVSGKKATISWKEIGTPQGLSSDYWSPIVNKAFAISSDQSTYLNHIMGYNKRVLGDVVYNIYIKNGGNLQKLTSASGSSATVNLPKISNPTLVVKTSYSVFGGAESGGVEVKVNYEAKTTDEDLTIRLNGENPKTVKVGSSYSDPLFDVFTSDNENITKKCDWGNPTVTNESGQTKNISSFTSEAGTYTITYPNIVCDGVNISSKAPKRTVKVE